MSEEQQRLAEGVPSGTDVESGERVSDSRLDARASRRRWFAVASACLACAALLALAEIIARFVTADFARMFRHDPVLGHAHRPNVHLRLKNPAGEWYDVHINALGLRDRERTLANAPGLFRVLVLGDSFVEGLHVSDECTFTRRLEVMLTERTGRPCEVINAGVSSFSPLLEYLYFKTEGHRFLPEVVMVFFAFNDPADDLFRTPMAKLDEAGLPVAVDEHRGYGLRGMLRTAANRLAIYRLIRGRMHAARLTRRADGPSAAPETAADLGQNPFAIESQPRHERLAHQIEQAWKFSERYLKALAALVRQQGSQLVLTVVPLPNQVSASEWNEGRQKWGFAPDTLLTSRHMETRLQEIASRLGVGYMPLLPGLQEASRQAKLFFDTDEHCTVAGHQAVAEVTARWLADRGFLSARSHGKPR